MLEFKKMWVTDCKEIRPELDLLACDTTTNYQGGGCQIFASPAALSHVHLANHKYNLNFIKWFCPKGRKTNNVVDGNN